MVDPHSRGLRHPLWPTVHGSCLSTPALLAGTPFDFATWERPLPDIPYKLLPWMLLTISIGLVVSLSFNPLAFLSIKPDVSQASKRRSLLSLPDVVSPVLICWRSELEK